MIVISPHFDDAIWSMGGAMIESLPKVKLMTVFTGIPTTENFSPFVHHLTDKWGHFDPIWAIYERRSEEVKAIRKLGLPLSNLVWVNEVDYMFRLGNEDHYNQQNVAKLIAGRLESVSDEVLYLPLSIGHHPDHEICFNIKSRLETRYYEDFPYCLTKTNSQAIFMTPITIQFSFKVFWQKYRAGCQYKTQVKDLFKNQYNFLIQQFRWYLRFKGERFWVRNETI